MESNALTSGRDKEDSATQKMAYCIYIIYLAAIILPMLPIVGVIFGYVFENDAKTNLKSHYQYIIRTFWIGCLYFIVSIALIAVGIGILLVPLCIIWWLIRTAKGLKFLMRKERVANPKTWTF